MPSGDRSHLRLSLESFDRITHPGSMWIGNITHAIDLIRSYMPFFFLTVKLVVKCLFCGKVHGLNTMILWLRRHRSNHPHRGSYYNQMHNCINQNKPVICRIFNISSLRPVRSGALVRRQTTILCKLACHRHSFTPSDGTCNIDVRFLIPAPDAAS